MAKDKKFVVALVVIILLAGCFSVWYFVFQKEQPIEGIESENPCMVCVDGCDTCPEGCDECLVGIEKKLRHRTLFGMKPHQSIAKAAIFC